MEMSTPGNDGKEGKEDAVGWPSTLSNNGSFLKTFEDIASELGISLCVHWKGFLSALKFGVVTFISFNPLVWFYFISIFSGIFSNPFFASYH